MKSKVLILVLALMVVLAGTVSAATISGTIVQWEHGQKKNLSGATVLIGKGIWLDTSSNVDVVKGGKVLARTVTDGSGRFSVQVPDGTYTMILWKNHYVPASDSVTAPDTGVEGSISYDNYGAGKHTGLHY